MTAGVGEKPAFTTTLARDALTGAIRRLTEILCRIDTEALAKVPDEGPLILVANHINFLEVPAIYTHLLPRPIVGYAKAETWDTLPGRLLANLWRGIPLKRGEADVAALREGLSALRDRKILAVAPEGTRSGDGRLLRGHPGVAFLALRSRAPLLPVAHWGGEHVWSNLRRLRRTDFHIAVGDPFFLEPRGDRDAHTTRQLLADAAMLEVAKLLPPAYRGVYAELADNPPDDLRAVIRRMPS